MIENAPVRGKHRVANRCPKCRGANFNVTTEVVITTMREFRNGVLICSPMECALPRDQASFGNCLDCCHEWRLRDPYLDYKDEASATATGAAA